MDYQDFLIRLLLAIFLSFIIGVERQWRRRAIGLRTNVLVCLGSFLFVSYPLLTNSSDVMKVSSQIVSGIGFLGAGVIIKDGGSVRGFNTVATLWCTAAIGILCAAGLCKEAITGAILILIINIVLRYITRKVEAIYDRKRSKDYILTVVTSKEKEASVKTKLVKVIKETNISLKSINIGEQENRIKIDAEISLEEINDIEHVITSLTMEKGIFYTGYQKQKPKDDSEEG